MIRPVRRSVVLVVPLLLSAALAAGCGGGGPARADKSSRFEGVLFQPPKPAPALALRDYTGQWVNLSSFRGQAVLVTFVYTHCRDVCPLIVANLASAERQLASEGHPVPIIAVTVDPARDRPTAVRRFLAARGAAGRMHYLIGTRKQLLPIWKAWGVTVTVSKYEAAESHSAVTFGVTPSGKLAVAYSSNVSPADVVHDVPVLARS